MTSTEKPTIDAERALSLMERAVEKMGVDYTYPAGDPDGSINTCVYVRDGEPSCLVGHALFIAGIDIDALADLDTYSETDVSTLARGNEEVGQEPVLPRLAVLSGDAVEVFQTAQMDQDQGRTWGEALSHARRRQQARERGRGLRLAPLEEAAGE